MKVQVNYVDSSVLGRCPASVDMTTGVVSINRSVWDSYDQFEKNFILFHELGHYLLDTDSEYEADAFALQHVYKTAPRSLKRALQTLCKIRVIDGSRLDHLYKEALQLDAEDGNTAAAVELEQINYFINPKNQTIMSSNAATESYLTKRNANVVRLVRRADGADNGKSHKRNGLKVGDWYFSLTNILLALIVLILLLKK